MHYVNLASSRSITELMVKEHYNAQLRITRNSKKMIQYFGGIRQILILITLIKSIKKTGIFWIVQKSNLMSLNQYRVFHIIRQRY